MSRNRFQIIAIYFYIYENLSQDNDVVKEFDRTIVF